MKERIGNIIRHVFNKDIVLLPLLIENKIPVTYECRKYLYYYKKKKTYYKYNNLNIEYI